MELLSHPLVILAAAWILAYVIVRFLVRRDVPGLKLYPLGFMLKSERTLRIFDRIASSIPSAIRVASNLGVAMAFGMMGFAIYVLAKNLGTYLFAPAEVGPQNIVIPLVIGVTVKLEHLPYLLLALGIVLVTHEGMHGLIARLEKIRLKSTGLFLFYIFPGGFVEPDEEEFRRAPGRVRARVAAGGSFANFVVGLLVVFLMIGLFSPVEGGVIVVESSNDSLLKPNDVIYRVNGVPVNRVTLFQNISASETLTIETSRGSLTYRLGKPINMSLAQVLSSLGVRRISYYFPMRIPLGNPLAEYEVYRVLSWIQLLAINVAIFNMLPIYFLDGSLFLNAVLERIVRSEKVLKWINAASSAACIALIALNIGFTFKTFGFLQI
ncbi:MAG: site-2 protease family protein [Thaumarchaeota archaeon]|nr:site-2 protease family protein [Nitrososphaerota archaeon]